MGVSRDYTTGNDGSPMSGAGRREFRAQSHSNTAVLERVRTSRQLQRPVRELPQTRPNRAHVIPSAVPAQRGRLGSKQVVSERGRLVGGINQRNGVVNKITVYCITILVAAVCLAMWLSGLSTAQTFQIQQLTVQENTLDNQLETLNRDLENVRSAADVARRAAEKSMGVPEQAGVVAVAENGDIATLREAKPETESIINVNGAPVRPGQASSDPGAVADIAGSLTQVPGSQQQVAASLPALAPYAETAGR